MAKIRYATVCSGIGAPEVAWRDIPGWEPVFCSEIEDFPNRVLAHHFPNTPNLGDFTKIQAKDVGPVDLLIGGCPCQSFSVAGNRLGLDDARGNLTLEYLRLAHDLRPRWIIFENVPGLLSIDGGRTFGTFLGTLAGLGYGWAYRVLDGQHWVPQHRKRVWVVGYLGDWTAPGEVLLKPESLCGNPTPGRQAGEEDPRAAAAGPGGAGGAIGFYTTGGTHGVNAYDEAMPALKVGSGLGIPSPPRVFYSTGRGWWNESKDTAGTIRASPTAMWTDGTLIIPGTRWVPEEAKCITTRVHMDFETETIISEGIYVPEASATAKAISLHLTQTPIHLEDVSVCQSKEARIGVYIPDAPTAIVRRLTPLECERCFGFPDNWTNIPGATDTKRYKALGNSMVVPLVRAIGLAIDRVESDIQRDK